MPIKLMITAAVLLCASSVVADEAKRLPKPLDGVSLDLGLLTAHFQVVESKLYQRGEFKTLEQRPRVIAEQVLVWTIEAKADVSSKTAYELFENPFPRVKFYSQKGDKLNPADAREQGYFLVTDRRWIGGRGETLKKGGRITVYSPIGDGGVTDLQGNEVSKVVFEEAVVAARPPRRTN